MEFAYIEWVELFGILLFGWIVCRLFGIPKELCRFWAVAWFAAMVAVAVKAGDTLELFPDITIEWLLSTQKAPVRYACYAGTIAWFLSWGGSIGGSLSGTERQERGDRV